jgi:hypothetical protein
MMQYMAIDTPSSFPDRPFDGSTDRAAAHPRWPSKDYEQLMYEALVHLDGEEVPLPDSLPQATIDRQKRDSPSLREVLAEGAAEYWDDDDDQVISTPERPMVDDPDELDFLVTPVQAWSGSRQSKELFAEEVGGAPGRVPETAENIEISADHGIAAWRIGQVTYQQHQVPTKPVRLPPRPPFVAGREGLLGQLRAALRPRPGQVTVAALHGPGGIGKSGLAVEYAYRHLEETGAVWFFPAESPGAMASGFADLAARLGLESRARLGSFVSAAHAALAARSGDWLLIFDNAPNASQLAAALPPAGSGQVIITSQNPSWPGVAAFEVSALGVGDAIDYLLRRFPGSDPDEAKALAEELGGLPLALAQAAGYMEATGRPLQEYFELYKERRAEMHHRGDAPGYDKRVATTWSLAFDQISQVQPLASGLLRLLSWFSPDDIPLALLLRPHALYVALPASGETIEQLQSDPLAVDSSIAALRRFSLINFSIEDGSVSVHKLVQAVTIDSMPPDEAAAWKATAESLADTTLAGEPRDRASWEAYRKLAPHARAVLTISSRAMARIADYLGHSGDPGLARDLLREVVAAREAELGAASRAALSARGQAAYWAGRAGNPATAKDRFADLVPQLDRALGRLDPDTLTARENLARWSGRADDHARARDELRLLVPDLRQVLGAQHPRTVAARDCLARHTGLAGDPAGARAMYDALKTELEQAAYKPDHPMVCAACRGLALWAKASSSPSASDNLG